MPGKHLSEIQQLTRQDIEELFELAKKIEESPLDYSNKLNGKILAALFYEPSTRTRFSFESAILKLGGNVIGTENAKDFSSVSKGESLEDTIRVVSNYADVIVLRHFEEGSSKIASSVSSVPVINAGDGKGQHPTQALLDLYTIKKELGRIENFKIAMVGDLASGRTVRSLCYLLGKFKGIEITFVSPENLMMKQDIKDYLARHSVLFKEEANLQKVLPLADIIYMTRIQKERISAQDYENAKGKYIMNLENLGKMKKTARVLHPLPHVEEISLDNETEISDSRVAYFRQSSNGLYIRMALLLKILSE